ncbi:MAG: hypothetical protein ACETWQ_06195 [Phycisphaerae bacterium]
MEENEKKETGKKIIQRNSQELNVAPSDISVFVSSHHGQKKEYTFPETEPSDIIVLKSSASTAADIGIQVLHPWQNKIKEEIDDIKNDFSLEEVELNFGIVKFKLKRKKKD